MSANCDATVVFSIYGQFGAIRKPDSGRLVYKTYISLTVTFYPIKNESRTKKSLKGIFSETKYVCVLTYQISSF